MKVKHLLKATEFTPDIFNTWYCTCGLYVIDIYDKKWKNRKVLFIDGEQKHIRIKAKRKELV